jgi:hypothetical protein
MECSAIGRGGGGGDRVAGRWGLEALTSVGRRRVHEVHEHGRGAMGASGSGARSPARASDRGLVFPKIFSKMTTVAILFVFNKYCLIIE